MCGHASPSPSAPSTHIIWSCESGEKMKVPFLLWALLPLLLGHPSVAVLGICPLRSSQLLSFVPGVMLALLGAAPWPGLPVGTLHHSRSPLCTSP